MHSVYSRKLDYLEAAINRGNQISGDCNVCVIVKLESENDVDVKDRVDKRSKVCSKVEGSEGWKWTALAPVGRSYKWKWLCNLPIQKRHSLNLLSTWLMWIQTYVPESYQLLRYQNQIWICMNWNTLMKLGPAFLNTEESLANGTIIMVNLYFFVFLYAACLKWNWTFSWDWIS